MSEITIISRNYTPFAADLSLDENAYRASLVRFLDARVVVYLASGGSGEGNLLSRAEVRRSYELGVEVFGGRQDVYANLPEVSTAQEAIDYAQIAVEAGVDRVNLYGPASLHGFVPSDAELRHYFEDVLSAIGNPVVLAPNPIQGYTPAPEIIAEVCARHAQVVGVNLVGIRGDEYFLALRDALARPVELNVPLTGSFNTFALGATGLICNLANILPQTVRRYVDLYEDGDLDAAADVYAELGRFSRYVATTRWRSPRWQKMAVQVLGLPGSAGGMRPPFVLPTDDLERFTEGLFALGIAEIDVLRTRSGAGSSHSSTRTSRAQASTS